MSIETAHEFSFFEFEAMEAEAQLHEAQRIIERHRAETERMQNQHTALNALNTDIEAAWAEVSAQQFAIKARLQSLRSDALNKDVLDKKTFAEFGKLTAMIRTMKRGDQLEFVALAASEPRILDVGNWQKLMLLLALEALFDADVTSIQYYVGEIEQRNAAWNVKERSGLLTLLSAWLRMPAAETRDFESIITARRKALDEISARYSPTEVDSVAEDGHGSAAVSHLTLEQMHKPAPVVLVEAIPGGDSDKDEHVVKKYKPLTEPMRPILVTQSANAIQTILDTEFPWMQKITQLICAQIVNNQRYQLDPALIKPIVLVGAPGSGKTRYLQRLVELMALPSLILSVGGMSDNLALKGSARSWSTSRPSIIAEFINQTQCPNPVVILDEIEKGGVGRNNGNVYDTLLQLLEPRNAAVFNDECLQTNIDLSRVTYLATANSTEQLPKPIKDRLIVLRVPAPQKEELKVVAEQIWWAYWAARQIPVSETPPLNDRLIAKRIKEVSSVRQVKQFMDVLLRHATEHCPVMRVH